MATSQARYEQHTHSILAHVLQIHWWADVLHSSVLSRAIWQQNGVVKLRADVPQQWRFAMRVNEIYERVTNNIISEIEAGNLPPWLKPWKQGKRTGIIPVNASTNNHYNGLNVLNLWCEREEKQWPSALWCTYKQCTEMGGQVRAGEKAAHVIYVKRVKSRDTIKGYDNAQSVPVANSGGATAEVRGETQSRSLRQLRHETSGAGCEQVRVSPSNGGPHQRQAVQGQRSPMEGLLPSDQSPRNGSLRGALPVLQRDGADVSDLRPHQRWRGETQTGGRHGASLSGLGDKEQLSQHPSRPLHELQHGGEVRNVPSPEDEEREFTFLKTYAVFNIAQCDGLPHNEPEPELPEHERNEKAEAFFAAINAEVRWGEAMAAYIPSKDLIVMPARGAFTNAENLYATFAHEHIHYSGHKSRLDRDLKSRFDKEAYAFEELIAEIGAAMTCATLQVTGELRHASYVESWLKVLKGDPKAILTAASMASKATDYLRSFSRQLEEAA